VDTASHISHLRRDASIIATVVRADPAAPVPSCPGWALTDLVSHLGTVHAWFRLQIERGPDARVRRHEVAELAPVPADPDELPAWFEHGVDRLVAGLETADPSVDWPTWAGVQASSFLARRMANETALHRWDAEAATGEPSPIPPDQAVDGIDELLEVFAPRAGTSPDRHGTVHLHATDPGIPPGSGEWLVSFGSGGVGFERRHAKGDVAVRALAGDLLLLAWNRRAIDDSPYEVFGDPALLDTWRSVLRF
jgi:uncharacterized protein (TIGR03083 family)